MRDEAAAAVIIMTVLVCLAAWSTVAAHDAGRCQSARWLSNYTYISTDATARLCDNAGVPVAVAVPEAPHGR